MAAKFVSAAEDELACGVCFKFFVKPHEPKNLPKCLHILCQICLQKMTEGGTTVTCPQCNKKSSLPKKGIDGLTTILALRNLAERHPKGIQQYKDYMQSQLQCGQEQKASKIAKLKEMIKQTQDAIQIEEQEIEKSVESIMKRAQELIKQLKNSSGLDQLQEQLSKLETEMKYIETSHSKLKTMTNEEFHAQTDAITNQIKKLKIDDEKEITVASCISKFSVDTHLGRIVKPRKLELVQEFGGFRAACGISSDPNGVLAVCDYQSKKQVKVYEDNAEYKLQRQFSVHFQMGIPLDVAISEKGKYLVTKWQAGFDVYSEDGDFQKTESVIDELSDVKVCVETISISSSKDGRILVGSRLRPKREESGKCVVTVHDKEGSLMKTIPIGITPWQIADINWAHVAVSDYLGNKVCVYDMRTGKETLSFDVQKPYGVCHDEKSDCLLIGRIKKEENDEAEAGHGVIEQYCRISGKLVACLAHGLYEPRGITITEYNMIAVADENTIKVYKLD